MLRQATNKCYIEGILSEIDLKQGNKDGKNYIAGSIKVKVSQEINGVMTDLEIPVQVFTNELKKDGNPNPSYVSIAEVLNSFVSIAAAGEDKADRVRISGASIRENAYYGQNGNLITFPRVNASFISKISASACKPKAEFEMEFVIANKDFELDKEGNETGRYGIKGIIPQYGGRVDLVDFVSASKSAINVMANKWEVGDSVHVFGKLNFTQKVEKRITELDFGDPIEKTYTTTVSELMITGGSADPLDDLAFDSREIKSALADRKARLEADKAKSESKRSGFDVDLGF